MFSNSHKHTWIVRKWYEHEEKIEGNVTKILKAKELLCTECGMWKEVVIT